MRQVYHTRRMGPVPALVVLAVLTGACASSGIAPVYELRPTDDPLTYVLSSEGGNEIETPAGVQSTGYSSEAVVTIEIGEVVEGGRSFSALIESFSVESAGDFGSTSNDLTAEVAGKSFDGILAPDGDVTFTAAPEFTKGTVSTSDLEHVVSALLFPLPPDGDPTAGPWPHRLNLSLGGALDGTSVYEGTVRMAGDTLWNGIPAAVLVSEGLATLTGSGQPQGAPAEVDMTNELETRTIYVWDPARGVLLAIQAAGSGAGEISTMGFSMPMRMSSEVIVTLQP